MSHFQIEIVIILVIQNILCGDILDNIDDLKKQVQVDNSALEEMLEGELTPENQIEFLKALKDSYLYLPVSFSDSMFEGIEDSKPGDVFETTGEEGFNINYVSDAQGRSAGPLFTSEDMMKKAGITSSVMVMDPSGIADMIKDSDRYVAVTINPLTEHEMGLPFEAFVGIFAEPTEEEKQFQEALSEMLEALAKNSYTLVEDMAFVMRDDEITLKDHAQNGVFVVNMPLFVSGDKDFRKGLKYTNILLFDAGKKVLPLGGIGKDEYDTVVAPGSEFVLVEEIDEVTSVWRCGEQPFYDEL